MSIKIPYFDRRLKYDASKFANNELQVYMALFLSKPTLYEKIHSLPIAEREDYFFEKFGKFTYQYVNMDFEKDFDSLAYFSSLKLEKAGSANICGGGGGRSNSGRKQMIDKHKQSVEFTKQKVDYLKEKFNLNIGNGKDERLFIGIQEPWKNPSPELLKKDGWEWVIEQEYSDETFTSSYPKELDCRLVPLKIRNKVFQNWKKEKNNRLSNIVVNSSEDDSDDEYENSNADKKQPVTTIVISDELQELLNEEW